ncbi:MAG: hypothetical protein LBK73_02350 [Treponema sp.]|jgi:hypothetical protein|nr:hypothetical protein [Treponema sp.]
MYIRTETDMEKELVKTMQSIEAKQNKAEVLNFAHALLLGECNIKRQYGLEPPAKRPA